MTPPPEPPDLTLTGDQIYDMIMERIEPELTTAQLKTLEEKYKDETPEEKTARAERYQSVFQEYDRQYAEYVSEQEERVRQYKKYAMERVEQRTHEEEEKKMSELESAISNM